MSPEQILNSEEFKKSVEFHGHVCPGLSMGYRLAKAAMEKLEAKHAGDEEIVAIVGTKACWIDAIQVITGCTFGKGNLIYMDYGKMVLTLFSRTIGKGVRLAVRSGPFFTNRLYLHRLQYREILEPSDNELLTVRTVQLKSPAPRSRYK